MSIFSGLTGRPDESRGGRMLSTYGFTGTNFVVMN
jgi:hypothetical protein